MTHGTYVGYGTFKCHCPECRTAWAVYRKGYIATKRALGQCCACCEPATTSKLTGKVIRFCRNHADAHNASAAKSRAKQEGTIKTAREEDAAEYDAEHADEAKGRTV